MVFAGDAGVGRRREPADRGRRQCDRLRGLRRVEVQQPRRGNRAGEDRDEAAVKALAAKARRDRFADPPRRLIAEHDRGQYLFAAGAAALGDRQARRGQGCAGMDDVAQIAVVAGRGVAHHRVDLRRVGERKFRAVVEPDRGVGPPPALARQAADDPRRLDAGAECGAGDRAGDQHRRVVERLRRQVGSGGSGNKFGEFAGDGHRADYRGSVQLSEKARAQLLNGRPSRCIGHGWPVACTPSRVSRAPNAGISRLHTP